MKILIILLVAIAILSGCASEIIPSTKHPDSAIAAPWALTQIAGQTMTPYADRTGTPRSTQKAVKQKWVTTKSTFLYVEPDFDSDTSGELELGDVLELPIGDNYLKCETLSAPGMTAEICNMYSARLRKPGWVLKKWIEKQ
ncbi:MAG: hypothetical protein WBI14_02630 [Anaerolineaceae bacterium]